MQSSLLRFLQRREQEGPPGKVRRVQRERAMLTSRDHVVSWARFWLTGA